MSRANYYKEVICMADGSVVIDTKIDQSGLKKDLSSLGKTLVTGITSAVTAAGTALVGLGTYATKVGSEFEAAMSKVAAISGASGDELQSLTDKAKEMGAKTKFSASESAQAFQYMAMAGWKTEDMLNGIDGIMSLAAADGLDLATTSDIVTDALTAFGLKSSDSAHFSDVLATAASNANTNVSMMGETFKYVAPVAGALGVDIEDTAEAIGLMANAGIKSSMAGTTLRSILTRLSTNAGKTSKSLGALDVLTENLGVEFYNTDGTVRNLNDVLDEARAAWQGLSKEQQANYGKTIAGQQGLAGWLALMNTGSDDVEKLRGAIEDCDGAADRMAATMIDNLQGDLTILGSAAEGFGISFYESMNKAGEGTGIMRGAVQEATEIIGDLTKAINENGFDGLVNALGDALARAINKIIEYLPQIVNGGTKIVSSLVQGLSQSASNIASAASSLVSVLIGGILDITNDLVTLGAELIIALCQGLSENAGEITQTIADGLVQLSTTIVNYLPQIIQAGIDLLSSFLQGIMSALPTLVEAVPEIISTLIEGLRESIATFIEFASELITAITEALPELIIAIVEALPDLIQLVIDALVELIPLFLECVVQLITSIAEALPEIILAIVEILPDLLLSIVGALIELIPTLLDCVTQMVMAIVEALPEIIVAILEVLPDIIIAIVTCLLGMIPQIVEAGVTLLTSLVSALPDIISKIVEVLPQIIGSIISTLLGMLPQLIECGVQLLVSLVEALPEIIDKIVAVIPQIIEAVIKILTENIPKIIDTGLRLFVALVDNLPAIIDGIIAALPKIINSVVNALFKSIPQLATVGLKLFVGIVQKLPQIISTIVGKIPQIVSSIISAFGGLVSSMADIGKNMLEGLWNGISGAAGWLWDNVSGWANDLWGGVCDFFGIHSPSKLFEIGMGKNLMLGLANGIQKNGKAAIDAAMDVSEDISNVDFDLGDIDYSSLVSSVSNNVNSAKTDYSSMVEKMRGAVDDGNIGVASVLGSRNSTSHTSNEGNKKTTSGSDAKPAYIQNDIYIDGKKTARVITPYVSQEMKWSDKK